MGQANGGSGSILKEAQGPAHAGLCGRKRGGCHSGGSAKSAPSAPCHAKAVGSPRASRLAATPMPLCSRPLPSPTHLDSSSPASSRASARTDCTSWCASSTRPGRPGGPSRSDWAAEPGRDPPPWRRFSCTGGKGRREEVRGGDGPQRPHEEATRLAGDTIAHPRSFHPGPKLPLSKYWAREHAQPHSCSPPPTRPLSHLVSLRQQARLLLQRLPLGTERHSQRRAPCRSAAATSRLAGWPGAAAAGLGRRRALLLPHALPHPAANIFGVLTPPACSLQVRKQALDGADCLLCAALAARPDVRTERRPCVAFLCSRRYSRRSRRCAAHLLLPCGVWRRRQPQQSSKGCGSAGCRCGHRQLADRRPRAALHGRAVQQRQGCVVASAAVACACCHQRQPQAAVAAALQQRGGEALCQPLRQLCPARLRLSQPQESAQRALGAHGRDECNQQALRGGSCRAEEGQQ